MVLDKLDSETLERIANALEERNKKLDEIDICLMSIRNYEASKSKYLEKIATEMSFMNIEKKLKLEAMGNLKKVDEL